MIDTRTAPYAALLLRVSLGILFLAHGLLLKVMTFGLAGTVGYFESIGYPGFFAYLVILGEIAGGLGLILGIWPRWVAGLLLPIMIGATLQHAGNGWVFSGNGGGWYFDDNQNPTAIILCPQTCSAVQSDAQAQIDVSFGCESVFKPPA